MVTHYARGGVVFHFSDYGLTLRAHYSPLCRLLVRMKRQKNITRQDRSNAQTEPQQTVRTVLSCEETEKGGAYAFSPLVPNAYDCQY